MKQKQTRRAFLLGSAALVSVLGVATFRNADAQSEITYDNPLAIPPILAGRLQGDTRVYDLQLQDGETSFFAGSKTKTKGINGSYLGPVLKMRTGEKVRLQVSNALDHVTTLHWHGLNLPARADGGPHQVIQAGETWSPEFTVQDAASTMWYHAHQMEKTAEHVWAGLAGLIVIEDDLADALELPSEYGVDDVPLVLQDRRFGRNGSMRYKESRMDRMAGMLGDIALVNGTVAPLFAVTTEKLRLRLVNGANASIYNLAFSDSRQFVQIGSDGGLLKNPVPVTTLRLAPGERAEIVVEFAAGQTVRLKSVAARRTSGGMGMGGMMTGMQSPLLDLVEFRAGDTLKPSPALPDSLASLPEISAADAVKTRKFLIEMPGMGPAMMLGFGGFTINGKSMDMAYINEVVKVGETEIWQIENAGPMTHPFHVHNTQFRILDRNGRPPALNEAGLKDTVVVDPGETVRILVRFDTYTDAERPYMYHCHILEHEDAGMMGQFTVV